MDHPLEIETVVIPMEGWVFLILFDNIIREDQPVHGLGVYQWPIERNKPRSYITISLREISLYGDANPGFRDKIEIIAFVNLETYLPKELINLFLRINTFRQAPVSNQPLQSPHSRIAVPEV